MISVRDVPLPLFKVKILNLVFRTYSCALLATHFPSPWTIVPSPTPIPPFLIATVICFREQASYTPTIHHFHFQLKTRMLFFLQNIQSTRATSLPSCSIILQLRFCFSCNGTCLLCCYYCMQSLFFAELLLLQMHTHMHTLISHGLLLQLLGKCAPTHMHVNTTHNTRIHTNKSVFVGVYASASIIGCAQQYRFVFFFFYFLCIFFITSLLYVKWCTLHRGPWHPHRRATACTIAKNSHNYRFFSIRIFSPLPHCAPTPHSPTTFANALWWLLGILVQRW